MKNQKNQRFREVHDTVKVAVEAYIFAKYGKSGVEAGRMLEEWYERVLRGRLEKAILKAGATK